MRRSGARFQAFRFSSGLRIACFLLLSLAWQSAIEPAHHTLHTLEHLQDARSHSATLTDAGCAICDSASMPARAQPAVIEVSASQDFERLPQEVGFDQARYAVRLPFAARDPPGSLRFFM